MTHKLTRTLRHDAHDDCAYVHCFWHHVDEFPRHRGFLACKECGHLYDSGGALRRAYRATEWHSMLHSLRNDPWLPALGSTGKIDGIIQWVRSWFVRTDRIYSCAFCTHDF